MGLVKKCKCKKEYKIKVRKYLGEKKHGPIEEQVIFENGLTYYYTYKSNDNLYYITGDKKYLTDINYYNTNIEEFKLNEFNEYFISEGEKLNNKINDQFSNKVNKLNEYMERLGDNVETIYPQKPFHDLESKTFEKIVTDLGILDGIWKANIYGKDDINDK